MKFWISVLLCHLCASLCFSAEKFSFLSDDDVENVCSFLPPPPQKGSAAYSMDSALYVQGKTLRETPRGQEAVRHEKMKVKHVLPLFGDVMGLSLCEKDFPALAQLVRGTMQSVKISLKGPKKKFARRRPYQDFGERTPIEKDEDPEDYTSYPSSHAARAWILALLFSALDPAHQDGYLNLGYEMGQSRVILGFHYQSDVEASRLVAGAVFARLIAEKSFQEYLKLAEGEISAAKKVR